LVFLFFILSYHNGSNFSKSSEHCWIPSDLLPHVELCFCDAPDCPLISWISPPHTPQEHCIGTFGGKPPLHSLVPPGFSLHLLLRTGILWSLSLLGRASSRRVWAEEFTSDRADGQPRDCQSAALLQLSSALCRWLHE
jgi:hypothetical protein